MVYKEYSFYSGNAFNSDEPVFALGSESLFVDRYRLISAYVPLTFSSTNSSNNQIVFLEQTDLRSVTVAPSQYNLTTFPSVLQTAMNSVSANNYVVTFDINTRSLRIVGNTAFSINPGNMGTTMFKLLGTSRYNTMPMATTQNLGVSDFSQNAPLMLTTSSLSSENGKMIGFDSVNCLAVIATNAPMGSFLEYVNTGGWLEANQQLSMMNFRLLDASTGQTISLGNNGFSVTLGILTDVDDVV